MYILREGPPPTGRAPRLIMVVLLLLVAAPARCWPAEDDLSPERRLQRWLEERGGSLPGMELGRACPTCSRGAIATKDLKAGQEILRLPNVAALHLGDLGRPGVAAEYARGLLERMHTDPAHNATWGAYWATQPGPDEVFTPEVFTDVHLAMLQCPELARLAFLQQRMAEEIYRGTHTVLKYPPLADTAPAVSLATFQYVTSLVASRYFGFWEQDRQEGDSDPPGYQLEPFVELLNHGSGADANAARLDDPGYVVVEALRAIKQGEEIVHDYQPGVLHRADMSLYLYGFVIPRERPLLCAVDLPSFSITDPFAETDLDDSAYDAGGELATRQEHDRLAARLASLPTTEAEDQAQLDGGAADLDWRQRALLQFRVMRKRALQQTLERLAAVLGEPGEEEAPAPAGVAAEAADAAEAAADTQAWQWQEAAQTGSVFFGCEEAGSCDAPP